MIIFETDILLIQAATNNLSFVIISDFMYCLTVLSLWVCFRISLIRKY